MIQGRLRELMAIKGRNERRRITYDAILADTGIAKSTLSRLSNDNESNVSLDVMNRLCQFFDCQPGNLFVYVREPSG